jgi:hypothetical protein
MSRLLLLALALAACTKKPKAEPPPEPEVPAPPRPAQHTLMMEHLPEVPKTGWLASSMDGATHLEVTKSGNSCEAHCGSAGGDFWTSDRCIGGPGEAIFLTADCSGIIVIVTDPPATRPWDDTPVVFTYRGAALSHSYEGGPMVLSSAVGRANNHYQWLKDTPHYLSNGEGVEFQVLGGRTTRLPLRPHGAIGVQTRYMISDGGSSAPAPLGTREDDEPLQPVIVQNQPSQPPPKTATPPAEPKPLCNERGCFNQNAQEAPTLKAAQGEPLVCHGAGEGCGNNADCCGGNCSDGTCQ